MNSFQIFGVQFVLSTITFGLIARWYVAPRLAALPRHAALIPLFFPHAFRHLGLVFLVPAVVAPTLPAAFAAPAAYGDLLAGILALLAIFALRGRWALAIPAAWVANLVGTLDLLYAFYRGISLNAGPHLGSAWYIPTFAVPVLYVTHVMIFVRLVTSPR